MFDLPDIGLRLRAFKPSVDLENILALENDVDVAAGASVAFPVPQGEKKMEEYKQNLEKHTEMCCIVETLLLAAASQTVKSTKAPGEKSSSPEPEFVGFAVLWVAGGERGHRHSSYSISLAKKFWNKGYGTRITQFMVDYAFNDLNMHRISLSVKEGNDGALAVYKKCGFIFEGKQRKANWQNGGWRDVIYMGILVDDWSKGKNEVN
ncbi:acyl-CoA N-acyltransferase [Flammula alnicola]|nr:acyl-CoA N-acyltransferase [Flammula alnicola]